MSDPNETGAEKPEKATSTDTKPESKTPPEAKAGEKKEPTTRELVKGFRAEQTAAKEAAASKKSEKAKAGDEKEPEKKGAEKSETKAEADGDEKGEETKEREFSAKDFEKAGFWDSLSKEDWKALAKQMPAQVAAWKAVQREAQKLKDNVSKTEPEKSSTKSAKEPEDDEDDKRNIIDLIDDEKTFKQGVKKLFNHPDAKPIVEKLVREYLKEEGLDLSEVKVSKAATKGLEMATEKYPELDNDGFFKEVLEAIDEDEDARETVKSSDAKSINRVLRQFAAEVKAARTEKKAEKAATKKTPEEERAEKLRRETQNAKTPGSKAPGTGRKPVEAAEGSTLETLRAIKATKDYQTI